MLNNDPNSALCAPKSIPLPGRKPTARMHASRMSKAKNAAQRLGLHRDSATIVVRPRPPTETTATQKVKRILGDCPPYNDKEIWIDDPENHRAFLVGGIRPGDESNSPTSDFWCCDTVSMRWENLSKSLTRRNPYDPFSKEERLRQKARLPEISLPGCALVQVAGSSFILIFGGFDSARSEASSRIIAIDLEHLEWFYLDMKGEGVEPRIDPAVVAIGNKFYVFGGYRRFEDDCLPHKSYSVAEFTTEGGRGTWRWIIRDSPYTNPVPENHVFGQAISVYDGTKIFLTPGRLTGEETIHISSENCFFYHTGHRKFQPATADFAGEFPSNISWYSVYPYRKPSPLSATPQIISEAQPRPRGRPRKNPLPGSGRKVLPAIASTSAALHTHNFSASACPSVIICAWIPFPDTDDIVPEIWHLFLSPEERIICLNIKQKMWDLDHDFQGFLCAEGRLRIIGTVPVDDGRRRRMQAHGKEDEEPTWNTYLDVSLDGNF